MDRKTRELCKCDTISLKRINVSCHKRTIISESECHIPNTCSGNIHHGGTCLKVFLYRVLQMADVNFSIIFANILH